VYPLYSKYLPQTGNVQSVSNGQAEWKITVAARETQLHIPQVEEKSIWAPSRRVNSNFVSNSINSENERHIFYRGLGRFEQPLSVKSNLTHLIIQNNGHEPIQSAWILKNIKGELPLLRRLTNIPAKASIVQLLKEINGNSQNSDKNLIERFQSVENYISAACVNLEIELTKCGLFELEARAMVDTWSSSYFRSYGLRVLYIAPESYPKDLLPWQIFPKPTEEKRVLVGRVEVLLFTEESVLTRHINIILQHYQSQPESKRKIAALLKDTTGFPQKVIESYNYVWSLGRFAEPKIRLVLGSKYDSSLIEEWILAALTY